MLGWSILSGEACSNSLQTVGQSIVLSSTASKYSKKLIFFENNVLWLWLWQMDFFIIFLIFIVKIYPFNG